MDTKVLLNCLFWKSFIVHGILLTQDVSGRSTSSPTTGNPTTAATPSTSTSSSTGSQSNAASAGSGTAGIVVGNIARASSSDTNQGTSGCPSITELPFEMCMLQVRQDAWPCDTDADCFLPNQICCPHYCWTHVCKRVNGDQKGTVTVDEAAGGSKVAGKVVPTNIKHKNNVPNIDKLAADFLKANPTPQ